jgi:hypothetical protein
MLLSYPRRLPTVALLVSAFSTVKWTAIAAKSVFVIVGMITWPIQRLRRGGKQKPGTPGDATKD